MTAAFCFVWRNLHGATDVAVLVSDTELRSSLRGSVSYATAEEFSRQRGGVRSERFDTDPVEHVRVEQTRVGYPALVRFG